DASAFTPDAYGDPQIRPLMRRITIRRDDELDALFPESPTLRLVATTRSGERIPVQIRNPAGHPDTPLTEAQVRSKFTALAEPLLGERRAGAAFDAWWSAAAGDVPLPMETLVVPSGVAG